MDIHCSNIWICHCFLNCFLILLIGYILAVHMRGVGPLRPVSSLHYDATEFSCATSTVVDLPAATVHPASTSSKSRIRQYIQENSCKHSTKLIQKKFYSAITEIFKRVYCMSDNVGTSHRKLGGVGYRESNLTCVVVWVVTTVSTELLEEDVSEVADCVEQDEAEASVHALWLPSPAGRQSDLQNDSRHVLAPVKKHACSHDLWLKRGTVYSTVWVAAGR